MPGTVYSWDQACTAAYTEMPTRLLETVEASVADLGLTRGAVIAEVHARASELGPNLCPFEVGPHLRLL